MGTEVRKNLKHRGSEGTEKTSRSQLCVLRASVFQTPRRPATQIGIGIGDDDTFDNQALIKDETGRVLFAGTQDKRRTK